MPILLLKMYINSLHADSNTIIVMLILVFFQNLHCTEKCNNTLRWTYPLITANLTTRARPQNPSSPRHSDYITKISISLSHSVEWIPARAHVTYRVLVTTFSSRCKASIVYSYSRASERVAHSWSLISDAADCAIDFRINRELTGLRRSSSCASGIQPRHYASSSCTAYLVFVARLLFVYTRCYSGDENFMTRGWCWVGKLRIDGCVMFVFELVVWKSWML